MSGTIQSGTAQILTFNGPALALNYTNSQCLIITCTVHSVLASYSESGLQSSQSRFRIHGNVPPATEGPMSLTIPFTTPSSGTIFFASEHITDAANLMLWSLDA